MIAILIAIVALLAGIGLSVAYKKKKKKILLVIAFVFYWLAITCVFREVFGTSNEKLEVEIFPPMVSVFGFSVSESVITMTILSGVILALSLVFRLLIFPRFTQENPKGFQVLVEAAVEWMSGYTKKTSNLPSDPLGGYMFAIALVMIGSAVYEMLGIRAPTTDLLATGALALITFGMIQYYGIRKKGILGRMKSLAEPTPVVFPFEIIGQISTPVSLACRLFGNMLGGLIIMDLLYVALGNASVGIPAALGLYFNVFHPLIQAYIFITLSLTFIHEAVE